MKKRNKMNRDTVLENEIPRLESTEQGTEEEQRTSTSNTVSCDATRSKPKESPVTDVYRHERKVQCCKKSHTVGTWNVRSMNQRKLKVVKHEMDRLNIDIVGTSELKWTETGHFQSDKYRVF